MEVNKHLTKADWQSALDVQDACNLSGVVHSLAHLLPKIRNEKDCTGTDYVNTHPIVILYLAKLIDLAGLNDGSASEDVTRAWKIVADKAEEQAR